MVGLGSALVTLVLAASGETVLLDFYGDWCPPCRAMAPVVDQLAAKGYPVRKVNVDREPGLKARFGISGIPCFVMLVDGREVDRVEGSTSSGRLEQMLARGQNRQQLPPMQLVSDRGPRPPAIPIPAVTSGQAFNEAAQPKSDGFSPDRQSAPVPGWRLNGGDWSAASEPQALSAADLIAVTVRLKIEDATGHSVGSGTIIDVTDGVALILTCGHLFRSSQGRGRIEVDLFGPTPAERVPGVLKHFDLERDLGLVAVRIPGRVRVARVAPAGYQVSRGAKVFNVGCSNGDSPTVKQATVTSLNKFLGTPNIEVSGIPAQARSGGGLYSSEGYVIGVCNAAVPEDNEGLYAALGSIHAELDQTQSSSAYRDDVPSANSTLAGPPSMPKEMPAPQNIIQPTDLPQRSPTIIPAVMESQQPPQRLTEDEQAALEEINRRRKEGAEVVCVIRPRNNPRAQSEIIVLDQASPAFLDHLTSRDPSGPPPATPDWSPRWLQPGYQGE